MKAIFAIFVRSCYSLACVNPADNWITLGGKKKLFLQWISDESARLKAEDTQQDTNKKCAFFKYDDSIFQRDSLLISKKHYIGIQPDGKVVINGMEGKKRDRPKFFNQVFSQLVAAGYKGYSTNYQDRHFPHLHPLNNRYC